MSFVLFLVIPLIAHCSYRLFRMYVVHRFFSIYYIHTHTHVYNICISHYRKWNLRIDMWWSFAYLFFLIPNWYYHLFSFFTLFAFLFQSLSTALLCGWTIHYCHTHTLFATQILVFLAFSFSFLIIKLINNLPKSPIQYKSLHFR